MTRLKAIELLIIRALPVFAFAGAGQEIMAQDVDFEPVLQMLEGGDYEGAISRLRPLIAVGCRARGFYLKGVAHSRLSEARQTRDNVLRALECSPPLQQRYRDGARRLLRWATVESEYRRVVIAHTLSEEDSNPAQSETGNNEELLARIEAHVPDIRSAVLVARAAPLPSNEQLNDAMRCAFDPDDSCPRPNLAPEVDYGVEDEPG